MDVVTQVTQNRPSTKYPAARRARLEGVSGLNFPGGVTSRCAVDPACNHCWPAAYHAHHACLIHMPRPTPAQQVIRANHAGVFMGFVAPWLGRHLSWALFAVSIVLIVLSLGMLCLTAFTNPGFLPRNHLEDDEEYG